MRMLPWLILLVPLGCNTKAGGGSGPVAEACPSQTVEADAPGDPTVVRDLRTRKSGTDWPCFLGPAGTSVSTEKGILTPWPRQGLRVAWQARAGNGYGMPSISMGRLFQFDR